MKEREEGEGKGMDNSQSHLSSQPPILIRISYSACNGISCKPEPWYMTQDKFHFGDQSSTPQRAATGLEGRSDSPNGKPRKGTNLDENEPTPPKP